MADEIAEKSISEAGKAAGAAAAEGAASAFRDDAFGDPNVLVFIPLKTATWTGNCRPPYQEICRLMFSLVSQLSSMVLNTVSLSSSFVLVS